MKHTKFCLTQKNANYTTSLATPLLTLALVDLAHKGAIRDRSPIRIPVEAIHLALETLVIHSRYSSSFLGAALLLA